MSGFDRIINDICEYLNDQTQIDVGALDQEAILIVGFTVRHELPQAIADFALYNHFSCVRLRFIPDMFGDALYEL